MFVIQDETERKRCFWNIKRKIVLNMNSFTKSEIEGQPKLWQQVFALLEEKETEINSFLKPLLTKKNLRLVLTGAGSSAFVGESAQPLLQKNLRRSVKAISTTDLVTHADFLLEKNEPTLLVSFARSGNSPESIEAVRLANENCREVHHLFITCNKEGKLIKYAQEYPNQAYAILLPEAANDKSLAMTGSFTSMLLTALLVGHTQPLKERKNEVTKIIAQGNLLLANYEGFKTLSKIDFDRVVFLGSGPMLGIARECHLKLQELTDGQIICKFDSFLGFRHGPRAVINEKTLMVYLFSSDNHTYKYELDLAKSIAKNPCQIPTISIGRALEPELSPKLNLDLNFTTDQELNIVPMTITGQVLGYYKSLERNLDPDNPSVSGAISRVVKGVTIYKNSKATVK